MPGFAGIDPRYIIGSPTFNLNAILKEALASMPEQFGRLRWPARSRSTSWRVRSSSWWDRPSSSSPTEKAILTPSAPRLGGQSWPLDEPFAINHPDLSDIATGDLDFDIRNTQLMKPDVVATAVPARAGSRAAKLTRLRTYQRLARLGTGRIACRPADRGRLSWCAQHCRDDGGMCSCGERAGGRRVGRRTLRELHRRARLTRARVASSVGKYQRHTAGAIGARTRADR